MPEEESLEVTLKNRYIGCRHDMLGQTVPNTSSSNSVYVFLSPQVGNAKKLAQERMSVFLLSSAPALAYMYLQYAIN